MKISIDTKEDSHEDIRKVIKMLQHLVGEESYSNYSQSRNIFDDPSPSLSNTPAETQAPTNAFSAMFGDSAPVANVVEAPTTLKKEEPIASNVIDVDELETY